MNRNTHGKMDNKKMYKKQYWTTNSRKNALKAEVSEWAALVFWENIFDAFQSMLNCNWPLLWSSILSQRQTVSVSSPLDHRPRYQNRDSAEENNTSVFCWLPQGPHGWGGPLCYFLCPVFVSILSLKFCFAFIFSLFLVLLFLDHLSTHLNTYSLNEFCSDLHSA